MSTDPRSSSEERPDSRARRGGIFAGLRPQARRRLEDVLRALLECEHRNQNASAAQVADYVGRPVKGVQETLGKAGDLGLVDRRKGFWRLTASGHPEAVRVMRAHRLIETRLSRESSVPPPQWHEVAHEAEHDLSEEEINRLADELDNPRFDPHGDPIPTREGRLPEPEGVPLLSWTGPAQAVIAHIEDEPPRLFARLAKLGITAGDRIRMIGTTPAGARLIVEGREMLLPVELAGLVRVRPLQPGEEPFPGEARRLSDIAPGGVARVVRLLPGCAGRERSRLLDLGFVPGSRVEHVLQNPFGSPVAYRVRGTLIALRREQADQVLVVPEPPEGKKTEGPL